MRRLLLSLLLCLCPVLAQAQGGKIGQDPWVSSRQGNPVAGATIAICQPLATTAASLTSTIATFTMASNPITAGYVVGMNVQIAGFTGADTYFNNGTLSSGTLTGGIPIITVTSTQIFAGPIAHANGSATSNGTLLQFGTGLTPCAGLSTIYTDANLTTVQANPFTADGLGNYSAGAPSGIYYYQIYGSGITTTLRQTVVSLTLAGGTLASNIAFTGNNTHSGTETFNQLSGCQHVNANQSIAAAVTALGSSPGCIIADPGTYTVSSTITLGQGQVISGPTAMGEGDGATNGATILKQANAANLSPMIKITGSQAGIQNLVVDGNKSNNPTSGPCVVHTYAVSGTNANRQFEKDVTVQYCKGDGTEVLSTLTGAKNEAAATQFDHVMNIGNDGDGLYCANSGDMWVTNHSEMENNGLGGGPYFVGAYTTVNTANSGGNTTVTWISGPKWTTDASFAPNAFSTLGRVVSINATRVRIVSIVSTTSMTVTTNLGVLSGVVFRMGSGVDIKDCLGHRYQNSDIGGNELDGIYMEGTTTASLGSNLSLIDNNQFGGNVEHDIEIQGWDSVGGGFGSQQHKINGNMFIGRGSTGLWTLSTYNAINVVDSATNEMTGNVIVSQPANGYKWGIQVNETVGSRELRDGIAANQFAQTFSSGTFTSNTVIPTAFEVNKDNTSLALISQPILANTDFLSWKSATGATINVLSVDGANSTNLAANTGNCIFAKPNAGSATWQFCAGSEGPIGSNPIVPSTAAGTDVGAATLPFANLWLGTAATNNFKLAPVATAAARTVTLNDTNGVATVAIPWFGSAGTAGYQTKRVSGCVTGAAQFSTCDTTVTWTTAFTDANYTAVCTGDVTTSGVPQIEGIDISTAKTGAAITVRTIALTAVAAQFTAIDCTAQHD